MVDVIGGHWNEYSVVQNASQNHCFSFKLIYYHTIVGIIITKTIRLPWETDLAVGNQYKIICPKEANYDNLQDQPYIAEITLG